MTGPLLFDRRPDHSPLEEMRALYRGCEVGAHTHFHPFLNELPPARMAALAGC